MKRERIEPYRVYALNADGRRRRLKACGLIVELRPGVEVEIDFAPHPNFSGRLCLLTPPASRMRRVYDEGTVDDFAAIFGASNILHVLVERRFRESESPSEPPPVPENVTLSRATGGRRKGQLRRHRG